MTSKVTRFEQANDTSVEDRVSIVIPTLNNLQYLIPCIKAIKDTCTDLDYEIIVACNDAKKDTLGYLEANDVGYVALETNRGFGAACNLGAAQATGQYICFLNDDTLPAKMWLHRLLEAIKMQDVLDAPFAAVGPVSNAVAGEQCIKHPAGQGYALTPDGKDEVAMALKPGIGIAHFLSGFCYMVDKEKFIEVKGFDERFFAGAEDNALSTALTRRGHLLGIVAHSYVFHHGSKTLNTPEFAHMQGGCKDVKDYYRWYANRDEKQTLATMYRVKIQNEYIKDIFLKSLKKSAEFSDVICILNDGTDKKFKLEEMLEEFSAQASAKVIIKHYDRDFDERRDRNELLEMAQAEKVDWILALDADEIMEDKVSHEKMRKLMATPVPHIASYKFPEYTFWNDESHWRYDTPWGKMTSQRMWKVQPGRSIKHGAKSTLHCEHVPIQPFGAVSISSMRIKHYGYVDANERARKYEWYEKVDTDKQRWMIGYDDYRHLVDESELKLRNWIEDNSIAVTTIMKNEIGHLPDWASQVYGFADEVVICDTGSEDESVAFAKWCGFTVVERPWDDNYAKPRNLALDAIKTKWSLQLDMDEVVQDWAAIRRMIDYPKAQGYMFYIRNMLKTGKSSTSETIRLFRNHELFRYQGRIHETIDDSIKKSEAQIFRSACEMYHYGYLIDDESLKEKMMYYLKLCEQAMNETPEEAKPYYNVAVHYLEMPELTSMAEKLLLKCLELNPQFYQARKELAMLYLRKACGQFNECSAILPPDHGEHDAISEMVQKLAPFSQYVPSVPYHVRDYMVREGRMEVIKDGQNGTGEVSEERKDGGLEERSVEESSRVIA